MGTERQMSYELFELLQNPESDMIKLSREILAGVNDVPTPTKVAACPPAFFTPSSPPAAKADNAAHISANCRSCLELKGRNAAPESLAKY